MASFVLTCPGCPARMVSNDPNVPAEVARIEIIDGDYPGAHFRIRMPVLSVTKPVGSHAHAA